MISSLVIMRLLIITIATNWTSLMGAWMTCSRLNRLWRQLRRCGLIRTWILWIPISYSRSLIGKRKALLNSTLRPAINNPRCSHLFLNSTLLQQTTCPLSPLPCLKSSWISTLNTSSSSRSSSSKRNLKAFSMFKALYPITIIISNNISSSK